MEQLLGDIPGVCVRLDDILVTGPNDKEHLSRLKEVLKRLKEHGLRLSLKKCSFLKDKVTYLGHVVSAQGLATSQVKVKAVIEAPEPTDVTSLRAFIGLVNYYCKFLPNLSTVLKPLTLLLRDGVKWNWSEECKEAMLQLKEILTTAPILAHFDPKLTLKLSCDASSVGVGAVLAHVYPNKTERPIAYASRTLTKAEENYAQLEREALAIVFGIKHFHEYLYGRTFQLVTDNQPLAKILGPKTGIPTLAAARLQRWAVALAAYSYTVEFKPSAQNANADALSRLPLPNTVQDEKPDVATVFNISQMEKLPITLQELQEATKADKVCSKVLEYTLEGWSQEHDNELDSYFQKKWELTVENKCLLWGRRVVIPEKYRPRILEELHRNHDGMVRMKGLARLHVWWPGLDRDIEGLCTKCNECQTMRNEPTKAPLQSWEWAGHPWERIHMDFAGPFLGSMFLVVVDSHSKWMEVEIMQTTTAEKVIDVLRRMFAANGLPCRIVTDNGQPFRSQEFAHFAAMNGIIHTFSAPYHPSTNGEAERAVQTFKKAMKKMTTGSLQQKVSRFLLHYRATPQTTTGLCPCEMFLKRRLRTRLDLLKPNPQSKALKKEVTEPSRRPGNKKMREFEIGDQIRVRDYGGRNVSWTPGIVEERTGPLHYRVSTGGKILKRHVDQMLHTSRRQSQTEERTPQLSTAESTTGNQGTSSDFEGLTPTGSPRSPGPGTPVRRENLSEHRPEVTEVGEERTSQETMRRYPIRNRLPPKRLIL